MKRLNETVQLLTVALNGAFIGAMILIAVAIVPFWQSSQPQSFLDWFTAYAGNIGTLMIPLGPGVLILAVIAFFLSKENKMLWGLTVVFTLANIAYFPIYYLPTNRSFSEQTIDIAKVGTELSTWLNLHWQRIFFAALALVTSVLAIVKGNPRKNAPADD